LTEVPYTIKLGTVRTTASIGMAKLTPEEIPLPAFELTRHQNFMYLNVIFLKEIDNSK